MSVPSIKNIENAYAKIKSTIHKTPIIKSKTVNSIVGKNVFFKCENFQKTGSFKARGALNAVLSKLENSSSIKGCVTHSSGNHGQALAWAANYANIESVVVVPKGTPENKIQAIKGYNGRVEICEANPVARAEACERISQEECKVIIPPYDDYDVICGQGTLALEFLEQVPELDAILVPISGGGMISGIALYAKALKPSIKIFGVEPEGKNLEESLRAKERLWTSNIFLNTKAEAIRMQQCGQITFPIMCELIEKDVFTISDEEMINATKFAFERLKIVVELASGASIAAALSEKMKINYPDLKNIGVVVCGGNIDINRLPWVQTMQ
jgi:serine racemase